MGRHIRRGPRHDTADRIFQNLKDHPEVVAPGAHKVEVIHHPGDLICVIKVWANEGEVPVYYELRLSMPW